MRKIINSSISVRYAKEQTLSTRLYMDKHVLDHFKLLPPLHVEMLKVGDELYVGARMQGCYPEDIKLTLSATRLTISARITPTIIPDTDEKEEKVKPFGIFRIIDLPYVVHLE